MNSSGFVIDALIKRTHGEAQKLIVEAKEQGFTLWNLKHVSDLQQSGSNKKDRQRFADATLLREAGDFKGAVRTDK